MSDIVIYRKNNKNVAEARTAAERQAGELANRFGLRSHWQDDTLIFERPGANGELAISEEEVILTVSLGLLLRALKPSLEREIQRQFDAVFGT